MQSRDARRDVPSRNGLGTLLVALVLSSMATAFLDQGARAESEVTPLLGHYHADSLETHRSTIERAIESGVADLSFITRPIVRERLHKMNPPVQQLAIRADAANLTMQFASKLFSAPLGGAAGHGQDPLGRPVKITYHMADGALVALFVSEDGEKILRCHTQPDGARLSIDVTISSKRLKLPIQYRLTYVRDRAARD